MRQKRIRGRVYATAYAFKQIAGFLSVINRFPYSSYGQRSAPLFELVHSYSRLAHLRYTTEDVLRRFLPGTFHIHQYLLPRYFPVEKERHNAVEKKMQYIIRGFPSNIMYFMRKQYVVYESLLGNLFLCFSASISNVITGILQTKNHFSISLTSNYRT